MLRAVRNLNKPRDTAPLQERVAWYTNQGYRVVSDTPNGVQLVKTKAFSFVWALFWFLFFGVGVLVYIFYYMAKRDQTVYLTA